MLHQADKVPCEHQCLLRSNIHSIHWSSPEHKIDESEAPVLPSLSVVCNVDTRDIPKGAEEILRNKMHHQTTLFKCFPLASPSPCAYGVLGLLPACLPYQRSNRTDDAGTMHDRWVLIRLTEKQAHAVIRGRCDRQRLHHVVGTACIGSSAHSQVIFPRIL